MQDKPLNQLEEIMTKHTQQQQKLGPTGLTAVPLAWFDGSFLESFTRTTEACGKAYRAWQEEVVRFTSERLERDNEFGRKLVACRDWGDAAKLQQDWAAAMAQDYLSESNRIIQLASKLGNDVLAAPMPRTDAGEHQIRAAE